MRRVLVEAVSAGIVPVLNGPEQLAAAVAVARRRGGRVRAFVHIDTALNGWRWRSGGARRSLHAASLPRRG